MRQLVEGFVRPDRPASTQQTTRGEAFTVVRAFFCAKASPAETAARFYISLPGRISNEADEFGRKDADRPRNRTICRDDIAAPPGRGVGVEVGLSETLEWLSRFHCGVLPDALIHRYAAMGKTLLALLVVTPHDSGSLPGVDVSFRPGADDREVAVLLEECVTRALHLSTLGPDAGVYSWWDRGDGSYEQYLLDMDA